MTTRVDLDPQTTTGPTTGHSSSGDGMPVLELPATTGQQPDSKPATTPRWRAHLRSSLTQVCTPPRFVSERPVSLLEAIAYARRGEWTEAPDGQGPARELALVYAYLVAIPVMSLAHLVIWVVERPARLATFLAVGIPSSFALITAFTGAG